MADSLQEFVQSVNGTSHLRVEHDFGDGFVRLHASEAERRQALQDIRSSEDVVLELLRNARDAHAAHVYIAMSREGHARTITVVDDGCGIPARMHEAVFEPRVTSKLDSSHMDAWGMHGRGMALFSIAHNSNSAEVMQSESNQGCSIRVVTDLRALGEKADQSTFPTFEMGDDDTVHVRGPKNIVRTACEFAIQSRAQCAVFVGAPSEVVATLYEYGMATLSPIDRLFCKDANDISVVKRLATAADPSELSQLACSMGLAISERTARRVIDGEIGGLEPLLNRVVIRREQDGSARTLRKHQPKASRSFRLGREDALVLSDAVRAAFPTVAARYYLETEVEPRVRSYNDRIVITIPVIEQP